MNTVFRNTINQFSILFREFGAIPVIFTNTSEIIRLCQSMLVNVMPVVSTNEFGLPTLSGMVKTVQNEYSPDYVIYINADILLNPHFLHTIMAIEKRLGENVGFM